jgi:hypothetical protein
MSHEDEPTPAEQAAVATLAEVVDEVLARFAHLIAKEHLPQVREALIEAMATNPVTADLLDELVPRVAQDRSGTVAKDGATSEKQDKAAGEG